jgi:ATP-dependent helicase/nuclease subunit A
MPGRSSLGIRNSGLGIPLRHRVVFAPAGSGKTHALSQRYIDLLKSGVAPERILTLTFTEKAAAEMKERIFGRLEKEDPALHRLLRDNVLKLRISTIHSFCLSLVRRFAPLLNLDPRVDVLSDTTTAWESAKYDVLMRVAENERSSPDYAELVDLVTRNRMQGWAKLSELFDSLFAKRVAVQRGRMVGADPGLSAAAARLRADAIGRAKIEGYARLFPREFAVGHDPKSQADLGHVPKLDEVFRLLEEHADVYRTGSGTPRIRGCSEEEQAWNREMCAYRNLVATAVWEAEFGRALALFQQRFLEQYTQAKHAAGFVDYDDMEYLAWQVLRDEEEWQNILHAFDEHTDHILVDEFQDTSFLQWGIIDKLTEEWRSGEGAKSDRGIKPTIFIVGDEKQSIYMFRDAKVEVFATAADKLELWLGKDQLERETLTKNYRSLQSVIDFNNALFSRLMSPTSQTGSTGPTSSPNPFPWQTRYAPFTRERKNDDPGRVELILARSDANVAERRKLEAGSIARRILSLVGPSALQTAACSLQTSMPLTVYDKEGDIEVGRACALKDIAILIRSRNQLPAIEQALREAGIQFLVLGGSGFYEEDEVRYLRSLLGFIADPTDDISLYITLRGPFFDVPERDLFFANSLSAPVASRPSPLAPPLFLWDRIRSASIPGLAGPVAALEGWLACVHKEPLARILSRALDERKAWARFWEPQREANVRKFLAIIEDLEAGGEHPLRILNALEQAGADEAKADVRAEDLPGVQVLTVHAAKGLQFPVVFLPGLDAGIRSAGSSGDKLVVEEVSQDEVRVSYIPDASIRREHPLHREYVAKEYEEEKRIFYVACTRARDALFLTGSWNERAQKKTRLEWLVESLGLRETETGFALNPELPGVSCITPGDIPEAQPPAPAVRDNLKPQAPSRKLDPHSLVAGRQSPIASVRSVTRNLALDFQRFGEDSVGLGDLIHKLLEEVSNGKLTADSAQLTAEIKRLLRLSGLDLALSAKVLSTIDSLLSDSAVGAIIKPQPSSFAELPIMYSDEGTTFTGRIDRVIVTETEVRLYDYKTFDVRKKDIPELVHKYYDGQLKHYEKACRRLWPGRKVSSFLVFTALPLIEPAKG